MTGTTAPGQPGSGMRPAARPDMFFTIIIVGIMMIIIFAMLGQRRDRKRREAMIGAVRKHDRVQTIGGVIGSIVEVTADRVVLKVDESSNTRITFARSAIQQVLTSSEADKADA